MLRSAKLSLKFSNRDKRETLKVFLAEYRRVCCKFINLLWDEKKILRMIPKETTSQVNTWLSARAKQAAAKQASGIVRGTRKKQKKRLFMIRKLMRNGEKPKALQRAYEKAKVSRPKPSEINPELDSRFVKYDRESNTSFNLWLNLGSIGNKIKLSIPLKKTKAFNKWDSLGTMKNGVRLSNEKATIMFECPDVETKETGETIGLDIGEKNTFTTSDGQASTKDIHGWSLEKITQKLARKQKGSRAFEKAQEHRKNYINWSFNQLDLGKTKELRIEDISKLRYKSRSPRRLSHWTYTEIFGKLERLCEEAGVQITKVSPTYTSQRCSKCGWVRKANRKGKVFSCNRCGNRTDADLNASRNLQLVLPRLPKAIRQKRMNLSGFYWKQEGIFSSDGGELIVPLAQETQE